MKNQKTARVSAYERFMSMSDAERDREVAKYDQESFGLTGKSLTPAQRALHRRAKRKAGRPKVGEGVEKIRISMERGLLRQADRWANQHEISRSQMIASALKRMMSGAA
ncbi:MAG TPA: hypothetical protein VHD56_19655 [Tepidisphaeraceae bacterium]|nr:hypothetical protein [Tepidisphaeraceae bacterium]